MNPCILNSDGPGAKTLKIISRRKKQRRAVWSYLSGFRVSTEVNTFSSQPK